MPFVSLACVVAISGCDAFSGAETPTPDAPVGDAGTADGTAPAPDAAFPAAAEAGTPEAGPNDVVIDESFANACTKLVPQHGLQVTWKDGACTLCRAGSDGPQFAFVDAPQVAGTVNRYTGLFRVAAAAMDTTGFVGVRIADPGGASNGGNETGAPLTVEPVEVTVPFSPPPTPVTGRVQATIELKAGVACVRVFRIAVTYVR